MRHPFAGSVAAVAFVVGIGSGIAGCANPPPPEIVANTVEWVRFLCQYETIASEITEIITDNPTVTDVRAIAKLICAEFSP